MIVLDEKKYAIECLNCGKIDSKPFFTLSIIAKYYYHCLEYKKSQIVKLLIEFLSANYSGYRDRPMEWQDTIERLVKNVSSYKLAEIAGVSITKSEIEVIKSINNKNLELVMFTILCLAKLGNARNPENDGWVNTDSKEIFKLARVTCKAKERERYIGKLWKIGLLDFPTRNDNLSVRVTFMNNDDAEELFISDFRELGYEYLNYKGGNFIRCAECGILTRGNKNKTKRYCKDCAAYTPMRTKTIKCVDCGAEFEIKSKDNYTSRCNNCNLIYKKAYYREYRRRQRDKQK